MIEWTEQKAYQELLAAGAVFEFKAFREPKTLTPMLISAMDYLVNLHGYYHKGVK